MRRLLLAALAAAVLSGCEPREGSSDSGPRFAVAATASAPAATFQYKEEIVRDAVGSGLPASQESFAQFSRAFFDGDSRSLSSLGVAVTNPADTARRKVVVPLAKAEREGGDEDEVDDVPPPDSLPEVDLPDAQPGIGPKGGGDALLGFDAFQRALGDWTAPLLSRLGWGAAKRRGTDTPHSPYRLTVHHTIGRQSKSEPESIKSVRNIQYYHMKGRAKRGKEAFDDIGYHFLVDGEGRIIEGRPVEIMGAHAGGSNDGNIGIALLGNFDVVKPTAAQLRSLERLAVYLAVKFRRDPSHRGFLQPHQHFTQTGCPGKNLLALLDKIRDDVDTQADEVIAKFGAGGFVPLIVSNTP
jgi:N-acetylmuramoyl-L-alanine amidase